MQPSSRDLWLYCLQNNADGTPKREWAVTVKDKRLFVRFNSQNGNSYGMPMPVREIEQASWTLSSAWNQAKAMVETKGEDGYQTVGTCTFDAANRPLNVTADPSAMVPVSDGAPSGGDLSIPQRAAPSPLLFWDVQADAWAHLKRAMDEAVARCEGHIAVSWTAAGTLPSGIPKIGSWLFDLSRHKGVKVRQAGKVPAGSSVNTFLFLLVLRETAEAQQVTLELSDKDGREIGFKLREEADLLQSFGTTLEEIRGVAEELALVAKIVRLAEMTTKQDDCWF